ncbi:BCD family MFS transporter [Chamaesiphon polymorphus]|uniref:MFS transporter n=1 Tax=Chamaesiphon polymorphus CCALA 037 TaxID=2107692 RepID=A0A2T1FH54_9CYAN|nr:BCD family MFS transporter [Chamaesiphon polymorphus]PSB44249.1 MFS transporter [Chamaesiphon polymorphus CCALA 037]
MTTGDLSRPELNRSYSYDRERPKVRLLTMIRLGFFQMGLGMMSVMVFGVLNRVLIRELAVPSTIATVILALTLFVAPARIIFGQLSDTKPLFGYYRTGYIWLGAAGLVTNAWIAVQVMWQLGASLKAVGWAVPTYGWAGLLAFVFALYGLSVSLCSTPFATLLVDITDEDDRSRLVAVDWSMLIGGTIVGAITIGVLLKSLEINATIEQVQTQIDRLFIIIPAIVVFFTFIATWGVERKYSRFASRVEQPLEGSHLSLGRALGILTASRQTQVFFTFLVVMTMGLFIQDPILETYGGDVFALPVGKTATLNAFWGTGTLLGLSAAGFWFVPKMGKQKTARLGCMLVAVSMVWVIAAGFTHNPMFLQLALLLFGICSGLVTTGAITLMLDLTVPETAGTFIGAWGLSQALARGFATIFGGAALDIGKSLFANIVFAYSFVFSLQALAMIIAVKLLDRVNVREFQTSAKDAVKAVIAADVD